MRSPHYRCLLCDTLVPMWGVHLLTQFKLPLYPVLALGSVLLGQGVVLVHGVTKLLH